VRVALALIALAACGTPPPVWEVDAGACVPYTTSESLMTPSASFKTDVMPIFGKSCSSTSCHGIADSPQGGLFLGAELKHGSDATQVYAGLVGKPSLQLKSMAFVTAGDPANSYLMHKLDGDQCMFETSCAGGDCQKTMPYDTGSLSVDDRDVIRRWIAQGAPAS
jgi:hypothetical protein